MEADNEEEAELLFNQYCKKQNINYYSDLIK